MERIIDFLAIQIAKSSRRPSRLLLIPYYVLFRIVHNLPGFDRLSNILHNSWRSTKVRVNSAIVDFLFLNNALSRVLLPLAKRHFPARTFKSVSNHYFETASVQLDANMPDEAWKSFQACLRYDAEPIHFFVAGICLMVGLGRFQEAMALFTQGNNLLRERAKAFGIVDSRLRFLDHFWVGGFGHIAQMDYFIKLNILEGRSFDESLLYIPKDFTVSNRYLLDQWRPFLNIIEDEAELPMPLGALYTLSLYFLAPRLDDGTTVHLWDIGAKTYQRWEKEGRAPLLEIDTETNCRGWSILEKCGIPRDAWFAVLHVREATSKNYHVGLHNVLNADIMSYLPAIEEIVRRGGWVIRMGDPSMTPLPASKNVFDYCQSDVRSSWMDIFLAATARFFVGTSSGPAYVPTIYGVPCVHTNWWPPAQRPWHSRDIFMPKLYRDCRDGSFLTLTQSLDEPFGYCNSVSYLMQTRNVEIVDNSSDDIRAAVMEMLDRLEGRDGYTAEDIELRTKAEAIYRSNKVHGAAVLSRTFLSGKAFLLD